MTAAQELLDRLAAIGAVVKPEGDSLILCAGQKPIPGDLVGDLKRAKGQILARLNALDPATSAGCSDAGNVFDGKLWRRHFEIRSIHWGLSSRRSKADAYSELVAEWRKSHGRSWPAWQCAGCDQPIDGLSALSLADGPRVHFDEERECLIRFGRRWRSEAVAALKALGLNSPLGFELL